MSDISGEFEKWLAERPIVEIGMGARAALFAAYHAGKEAARAQSGQGAEPVGYQSELIEKINAVSRRSLDGSVVMSSEEWNGIVELVEKLITATPHPEAGQSGGVPEKKPLPDLFMSTYHEAVGWNACVDAMLTHPQNGEQGGEWIRSIPSNVACEIYNSGYISGHHDTVEGGYSDIHHSDRDSYHEEQVTDLLEDIGIVPQPPKSKEDRDHE